MGRRRHSFDESRISRFQAEGRGTGTGADYKPWLTVQDVPSIGRTHRPHGLKTGRVHHLLSDIERDLFYILDWSSSVLDIREQFPLDRAVTQTIAERIGVQHPRDTATRTPLVMTTDFLCDVMREGRRVLIARSVKPADKLEDERVIEKQEIERRYWVEQGVDWGIVTDADIPATYAENIGRIHNCASVADLAQPYPGYYAEMAALIAREVPMRAYLTLHQFCAEMDLRLGMPPATALMLIRHLIVTRVVVCDLMQTLDYDAPLTWLRPAVSGQGRQSA
ncbi:TnsA endonuclease N-terminal domain-containing protein [Azospirillum sp. TSA6c]|uniref:TnsA endonuclease N-terminal domain-containing protein n=1 Tax=unclassified Azospirillum TaxID=2630922 RepID=UPI000D614057|nr:TnsA endonuclease N-terminal domain-containing protein [Azospirillum sp. TSA6c]PWC47754.1 transposase [Azospirillum sp. TSA6c]